MSYPIIIIPGVFDSTLYFDASFARQAWPIKSVSQIMDLARRGDLKKLEAEYAGVPMYVRDPVCDTTAALPEYGAGGDWKNFVTALRAAFPSRAVWFFPYDFRQLSTVTRVRLKEFIDTFDTPVDIVCHSYGCNLVAAYMSAYGGDKIHRVAALAPPFEGSPEILLTPPQGVNFPCMGELAPSPAINAVYPVTLKETPEAPAKVLTPTEYDAVLVKFFGTPWISVDYSAMRTHPGVRFGVGSGHLTTLGTEFTLSENGDPYVSDFTVGLAGDGTVPALSATMCGALDTRVNLFPGVTHAQFSSSPAVQYWTMMQLNSGEPPMCPFKLQKGPYIKITIDGQADINVRRPLSVKDMISPDTMRSATAESLVIGPDRNINLLLLEPQECVIEIYSLFKPEVFKILWQKYENREKCIAEKRTQICGRYIRMTMNAKGELSAPFALDLPFGGDNTQ